MGVAFPVSEILLLSKTAKFPFLTMDYSPWSSKNSNNQNRLKKFMQVGIDVKYMHTNFGERGFSSFRDILRQRERERERGRETERNKEKEREREGAHSLLHY